MTVQVELGPEQEAQLLAVARREGLAPADLARRFIADQLASLAVPVPEEDEMLALFAQWEREDANMTPHEIATENQEWDELKVEINAERDRAGARRVF